MIIAKNDEEKRSRIWRIVTTVSSALIVIIGIYLLTKMFTTNPLEGESFDEIVMILSSLSMLYFTFTSTRSSSAKSSTIIVIVPLLLMLRSILPFSSIHSELEKLAEKSDGHYTKEDLEAVVDTLTGTFSYSVDKKQLTLSEREYGEQMIFTKK